MRKVLCIFHVIVSCAVTILGATIEEENDENIKISIKTCAGCLTDIEKDASRAISFTLFVFLRINRINYVYTSYNLFYNLCNRHVKISQISLFKVNYNLYF